MAEKKNKIALKPCTAPIGASITLGLYICSFISIMQVYIEWDEGMETCRYYSYVKIYMVYVLYKA